MQAPSPSNQIRGLNPVGVPGVRIGAWRDRCSKISAFASVGVSINWNSRVFSKRWCRRFPERSRWALCVPPAYPRHPETPFATLLLTASLIGITREIASISLGENYFQFTRKLKPKNAAVEAVDKTGLSVP